MKEIIRSKETITRPSNKFTYLTISVSLLQLFCCYRFLHLLLQSFKTNSCNLIIKTALEGELAFNVLSSLSVYNKEMEMYDKVLPKVKVMLQQIDKNEKMFADTVHVSYLHKAMVIQDLSLDGYHIKTTKEGYDFVHAKMILTKLAKFHGICAILQQRQPNIFQNFKYGKIKRKHC